MLAPTGISFRTWRSRDLESLVRHANNRNVWVNLKDRFPHPYTRDDAERWISYNHSLLGPPNSFAVDLHGEAIGGVGIEPLDDVQRHVANIGYWLGQPFWGKGYATAAALFITEYALDTFALDRLQANVFSWNPASARVLEKTGYRFEARHTGGIKKDGRVGDLLVYARLRTR